MSEPELEDGGAEATRAGKAASIDALLRQISLSVNRTATAASTLAAKARLEQQARAPIVVVKLPQSTKIEFKRHDCAGAATPSPNRWLAAIPAA